MTDAEQFFGLLKWESSTKLSHNLSIQFFKVNSDGGYDPLPGYHIKINSHPECYIHFFEKEKLPKKFSWGIKIRDIKINTTYFWYPADPSRVPFIWFPVYEDTK